MLKLAVLPLVVASAAALGACSSPSEITMRDGEKKVSADQPEVDKDTGFLTYERDGREVKVNPEDVRSIESVD